MGHKIKPIALRLGITENWRSRGLSRKDQGLRLEEDELIRKIVRSKILQAGIDKIEIERTGNNVCRILIHAVRPGLIIGRGGKGIEELYGLVKKNLAKWRKEKGLAEKDKSLNIDINVEEIKKTDISASVMAQSMAWDMERRQGTRQIIKKYLDTIMQYREVKGAKILFSGRLDGAEIARNTRLMRGVLPLQMLRAKIDYGEATAFTIYGTVGIKVWIYKGEIFENAENKA